MHAPSNPQQPGIIGLAAKSLSFQRHYPFPASGRNRLSKPAIHPAPARSPRTGPARPDGPCQKSCFSSHPGAHLPHIAPGRLPLTTTIISTDNIGVGNRFAFAAAGDVLVGLPGVTLGSTTSTALSPAFRDAEVAVPGTMISASRMQLPRLQASRWALRDVSSASIRPCRLPGCS